MSNGIMHRVLVAANAITWWHETRGDSAAVIAIAPGYQSYIYRESNIESSYSMEDIHSASSDAEEFFNMIFGAEYSDRTGERYPPDNGLWVYEVAHREEMSDAEESALDDGDYRVMRGGSWRRMTEDEITRFQGGIDSPWLDGRLI